MTVLDVGANIGSYTLLAAKRVGPEGRVYAFEPDPRTRASLERNVRDNRFANVIVVPCAASDSPGSMPLYQSETAGYSSLHPQAGDDGGVGTTVVEGVRIDDVVPEGRADVVKMDVEGHEPLAFRGMERIAANSPRLRLFLEFNPDTLASADQDVAAFAAHRQARFRRVQLIDENAEALAPFDPGKLTRYRNIVCLEVES
jgi:FkbM family methyltransferase